MLTCVATILVHLFIRAMVLPLVQCIERQKNAGHRRIGTQQVVQESVS